MKIKGKSDTFEVLCTSCDIRELKRDDSGPLGGQKVKCPECGDDAIIENDRGIVKVYGGDSIDSKITS